MTKEEKDFYKQLHHIIRLYDILFHNVKVIKYVGDIRDYMLKIKRGLLPNSKEEAFALRDEYVEKLKAIYEDRKITYSTQVVDYLKLDSIVKEHFCKKTSNE